MRTKEIFRIPLIGILLSVLAVFMLLSFNKIVSRAAEGDYLTLTAECDGTMISFTWESGSNVQVSFDGGETWSDYSKGQTYSVDKGTAISFKANNIKTNGQGFVVNTGRVLASGDVTSLTNGKGGDCRLSEHCYDGMFYRCYGLMTAPSLPSTTLAAGCYKNMFYGCDELTAVPSLPATTLAGMCYYGMFEGCTGLIIKSSGTDQEWSIPTAASSSKSNATDWNYNMFAGTSSESDVEEPETGVTYYIVSDPSYGSAVTDAQPSYLTFTAEEDSTISFDWETGTDVKISTDGGNTWSKYVKNTTINLSKNNKISFKANYIETGYRNHFQITGKVSASGDVTSLINSRGGNCRLPDCCFSYMFRGCTGLTTAPSLPSTGLTRYCYSYMFRGCTGLTTAPSLPATILTEYCYSYMFDGCTGLTTAPSLPSTTLAYGCYHYMFNDCSSLTSAPELPATVLAGYCYGCMFNGCSSLTSVPELPATTLAEYCYYGMFYGCTGLTSVPKLPATTLAGSCYEMMFTDCTGLIIKSSGSGKEWSIPAEAVSSASNASDWNEYMFYGVSSESDVTEPEPGVTYYISADTTTLIKSFVTRLYKVCLDRAPDETGLNNWVNALASGEKTGVDVATGFIFSTEFSNHNYCNSCYVEHLYNAFMGRASDSDGKAYWINKLETGITREEVFNGFALSNEFKNICDEYGIVQGEGLTIPEYGTVPKGSCSADGTVDGVTSFVTRLYNVCLDRDPDEGGLNNWTNALWNHERSGSEIASGFIFSQEFTNKNYDDETYVEYLYRAFFDRASDSAGKADWVSKLRNGVSREDVFNGFTGSQEFMTLCAKYGIVR